LTAPGSGLNADHGQDAHAAGRPSLDALADVTPEQRSTERRFHRDEPEPEVGLVIGDDRDLLDLALRLIPVEDAGPDPSAPSG